MVYYDTFDYQKFWQGRDYEDHAERLALGKLILKTNSSKKMIEIGCGFGRMADFYQSFFKKCTLVDPSIKLLHQAKKNLKDLKKFEFIRASAHKIPVADKSYDYCLMIRVCHHLTDLEPAIREIKRVLKPNGYLVLEFANKINFRARIRSYFRGEFDFSQNIYPVDLRSSRKRNENYIDFCSHHPYQVEKILKRNGFAIEKTLSVSNFRNPFIKKITSVSFLLKLEDLTQSFLAKIYFGPSIFLLCRKKS